jgi:type I restriction enzyme R subunit
MRGSSPTEALLEQTVLAWFESLGFEIGWGPDFLPDQSPQERQSPDQGFLCNRFRDALVRLNPTLSPDAIQEAYRKVTIAESPSLIESNHRFHKMLTDGVDVAIRTDDGEDTYTKARLFDFDEPLNNEWLVANQFSMLENNHHRRADVVVFVNGLPLAVIELKNPSSETASAQSACKQLQTYQHEIPSLFLHNEIVVASDGLDARAACLTANWEWFLPWKTIDGDVIAPPGTSPLEVLIKGIFDRRRFLDIVRQFIVYESDGSQTTKKMARYHQYHAVSKALECTTAATAADGDGRIGVVWHTQGSGKSLTMAFYAGKLVQDLAMRNPTIVVLTDRNDLDDQLFGTFSRCQELLRQQPVQANDRGHLQELLTVPSGGVVFTTIQKFFPEGNGEIYPCLSERRNIVVIADEAHRSQYDFIDGFARHMRDALPNASFVAFTGTPIALVGRDTVNVFGDYIDRYDIRRAVVDGATVSIYYEGRMIPLELREEDRELIDTEFDDVTEDRELDERERLRSRWARLEALAGAEKRVKNLAEDLVEHFEQRLEVMDGKAMVVCMSRRICVDLYNEIVALRPDWHSDDDGQGQIKVVMTGSASDDAEWQQHIRTKARREALARRFKDPDDPLKLVLVRDMWLTGFDAPCLHTMYCDKPMHGHGLMQAIARVNRVFRDKPGGLVVDYLGWMAEDLKKALQHYSEGDQQATGIDQAQAVAVMMEEYEIVGAMFHGFDYSSALGGSLAQLLALARPAMEHILSLPSAEGEDEPRKRYLQHTTALSRAFALAVPLPAAIAIRDEVAFFQQIRTGIVKVTGSEGRRSQEDVETAIRQIVSRAVVSGEIVNIFAEAGLVKPDISVLSEQFLADIRGMEQKNLAAEALRKLLEGEIRIRQRKNPLEARSFAELLQNAIIRYRNRTIEAAQVIEELIEIAREIREASLRGEQMGLNEDELAFYDALALNESAVEVMGDEQLRIIAREVLGVVRENATIDWSVRESTRAHLRVLVKRILRKYGYPPDLETSATDTVIEQAEQLCDQWVEN